MRTSILALLLFLAASFGLSAADAPIPLWFYYSTNFAVKENVDALEAVFRRAAKAGYSHVLLQDTKFGRLGDLPRAYFDNVERTKKLAVELNLQLVPAVFPIGYSESLLFHNPNLAEALPVRETEFVVENGTARPSRKSEQLLKGGSLESFEGWSMHDPKIRLESGSAVVTDPAGNARLMQKVPVSPFRQYHVSVEIKTQDFAGTPEIKVLDEKGNPLNYDILKIGKTEDWNRCDIVFNSLQNQSAAIYFGCWNGTTGTLAWRNPRLEETALVNLVRREGAPLEIRISGQDKSLTEGKDFEKVIDPKMGSVPWNGSYDHWHEPPVIRTTLPDGTRLLVSFYHVLPIHHGQVNICPSEPETLEILRDQAKRMHALFGARAYFMSHDEIRVLNWDKSCQDRHLDAGAILAENVKACIAILREVNPGGDIYVWSDMFDPHHNAKAPYYLVNGDLKNSWEGLDRDVIIAPWYFGKRAESIAWFDKLGNRLLIAGYYDSDPQKIREWLAAARPESKIVGVMYTTWENDYTNLETFAASVREP